MIELADGDILQADSEALVNTVNCVGIMGRGVALQFRQAYPENYKAYKALCDRNGLHPGHVFVFDLNRFENPRYVINFPTKRHWKGKSRIEDIESGLESLITEVRRLNIHSIALPPLGCGLGGLDWEDVRPRIIKAFKTLPDVRVLLFQPHGAPAPEKMVNRTEAPEMTEGRAALLGLIRRYLAACMDANITLLEIHKLMYFMQEAGERLRLTYTKGTYGPYAQNLRHVLTRLEGHFIIGFGDAADNPDKEIRVLDNAFDVAERALKDHPNTLKHFDLVVNLIEGFETPFAMELISTVHWVVKHEGAKTVAKAKSRVYDWNDRKKMFKPEHIDLAFHALADKGWISASA